MITAMKLFSFDEALSAEKAKAQFLEILVYIMQANTRLSREECIIRIEAQAKEKRDRELQESLAHNCP